MGKRSWVGGRDGSSGEGREKAGTEEDGEDAEVLGCVCNGNAGVAGPKGVL